VHRHQWRTPSRCHYHLRLEHGRCHRSFPLRPRAEALPHSISTRFDQHQKTHTPLPGVTIRSSDEVNQPHHNDTTTPLSVLLLSDLQLFPNLYQVIASIQLTCCNVLFASCPASLISHRSAHWPYTAEFMNTVSSFV